MSSQSSIGLIIFILAVGALVWCIELFAGFDRLTLIALDTPQARTIVYAPSAFLAFFTLHALFTGKAGSAKLKELKRERLALWFPTVIVVGLFPAAACFWLLQTLAGSAAQHLDGTSSEYSLELERVTRINGTRNQCLVEVTTREIPGFAAATFCAVTRHGEPIGPRSLQTGDKVLLVTKSTPLGTVATSVRPVS